MSKNPVFIISAEDVKNNFIDNAYKTDELKQDLNAAKLAYKIANWVTTTDNDTTKKVSFIVEGGAGIAFELCAKYNQDCAWILNENRDAAFLYNYGEPKELGRFRTVDKKMAVKFEDYIFDGNRYWVAY